TPSGATPADRNPTPAPGGELTAQHNRDARVSAIAEADRNHGIAGHTTAGGHRRNGRAGTRGSGLPGYEPGQSHRVDMRCPVIGVAEGDRPLLRLQRHGNGEVPEAVPGVVVPHGSTRG